MWIRIEHTYTYICVHIYTCMNTYTYICVHTYTCTIYTRVYMHTNVCIRIVRPYAQIHRIHTHKYTGYIHTNTPNTYTEIHVYVYSDHTHRYTTWIFWTRHSSVKRCVFQHCNTLQHTTTQCSTLFGEKMCTLIGVQPHHARVNMRPQECCSVLQCAAVCCRCCCMLYCAAVCCSVLQCVAVCCSVLQCVAVCCSVLQR